MTIFFKGRPGQTECVNGDWSVCFCSLGSYPCWWKGTGKPCRQSASPVKPSETLPPPYGCRDPPVTKTYLYLDLIINVKLFQRVIPVNENVSTDTCRSATAGQALISAIGFQVADYAWRNPICLLPNQKVLHKQDKLIFGSNCVTQNTLRIQMVRLRHGLSEFLLWEHLESYALSLKSFVLFYSI